MYYCMSVKHRNENTLSEINLKTVTLFPDSKTISKIYFSEMLSFNDIYN